MDTDLRPVVVYYGFCSYQPREKSLMTFLARHEKIVIEAPTAALQSILRHCTGHKTLTEIRQRVPQVPQPLFDALVRTCIRRGILQDSRELYLQFHTDTGNPQAFTCPLSVSEALAMASQRDILSCDPREVAIRPKSSRVLRLLRNRRSTRTFSGRRVSLTTVSGLLEAMYGMSTNESTPSAGGIYPLRLYVAVLREGQVLPVGWYAYEPARRTLCPSARALDPQLFLLAVDNADMVTAPLGVVVTARLSRHPAKYANRGYRYSLLEAGHVAQNAYLYCVEQGLGIVEFGGFKDEATARLIALDYPREAALTMLFVGYPSRDAEAAVDPPTIQAQRMHEALVGDGRPVEWMQLRSYARRDHVFPFVAGIAKYRAHWPHLTQPKRNARRDVAFAVGRSSAEATVKVLAEAYERHASGVVRVDVSAPFHELDKGSLTPDILTPLDPRQYHLLGLEPFNPTTEWQWVKSFRMLSGKEAYVAIDNVFYPLWEERLGRKPCVRANSTGVAAHARREEAMQHALLELIERDAIAVTWYCRRRVKAVRRKCWPAALSLRAEYWEREGWSVKILDLTLDSVPVMLATIACADQFPAFVSGAGANFDREVAMVKALDEAELMLVSWLKVRRPRIPPAQHVAAPHHHGLLYFRPENLRRVSWLLSAPEENREGYRRPVNLDILLRRFDPVVVDLNQQNGYTGLRVVRVLSEHLLPLNFGHGSEHRHHGRCRALRLHWARRFPAFPHFFA